jgi:hypothetical protein
MTQQSDDQNVSQKRDESSAEQSGGATSSNLNDLVSKSRQATQEADEALKKARQGGQPSGQSVQQKGQEAKRQSDANAQNPAVSSGSNREAAPDNIGNPDAAQGSSSDGDSAP